MFRIRTSNIPNHPTRRWSDSCRLSGFIVAILLLGVAPMVLADDSSTDAGSTHSPTGDVEIVERLLSDLDSADWRTRESATQTLMDYGPEIYETLRDGFLTSDIGYEARRRIERIAREIHLTESLGPGPAFLGISLARGRITFMADPRVPADATALLIEHVFLGTAADRGRTSVA